MIFKHVLNYTTFFFHFLQSIILPSLIRITRGVGKTPAGHLKLATAKSEVNYFLFGHVTRGKLEAGLRREGNLRAEDTCRLAT